MDDDQDRHRDPDPLVEHLPRNLIGHQEQEHCGQNNIQNLLHIYNSPGDWSFQNNY